MRTRAWVVVLATVLLAVTTPRAEPVSTSHGLPARLSDGEFWQLVTDLSEGDGYFQSDNLVSNEITYQWVIPRLLETWSPGQVYLGVGPDQNFTYIASLKPSLAFIVDIRRDNLRLQLFYKALIEMSPTRQAFLERLLSRGFTDRVPPDAPVERLFQALAGARAEQERFAETLTAVRERLLVQHGFALTERDLGHLEYVLTAFFYGGPGLTYANTGRMGRYPSYQDLMVATDEAGDARSYLSSDARYAAVRDLQLRNLIVPVVGDFSGHKALRAVGEWIKARRGTIGAIYTSNVEQYLFQYGTWPRFYANVRDLPMGHAAQFIRSCFNTCMTVPWSRSTQLLDPVDALLRDVAAGRVLNYYDLLARSR